MAERLPSKEQVEQLRQDYPQGTRVELRFTDDPYTNLKPGDRGTVECFDDTGTCFVRWDNGSGLGLLYGHDHFKKLEREIVYENGGDFWRDNAAKYSLGKALSITRNYLATQMKQDIPEKELQFCREIFDAAVQATAGQADLRRVVYPYDIQTADHRFETSNYHDSRNRNTECAAVIDAAIRECRFKADYYHLDLAAMKVILSCGFDRVNKVLARNIQKHEHDGRYSSGNKNWAAGIELPPGTAFEGVYMDAHPILLEDLTHYTRAFYEELGGARLILPGRETGGEFVEGYEIIRAVAFEDQRGFVIGHNPEAVNPYVTWQFTAEEGKPADVCGGHYADSETAAADNFIWRAAVHCDGKTLREVEPPGFNQERVEARAERPETAKAERTESYTSVLKTIEEAQKAPKPPRKTRGAKKKTKETMSGNCR